MSAKSTTLAVAFLVIGLTLIAISIPVTFSGVGGVPGCCPEGVTYTPPRGAIAVTHFVYIEPALFVGLGLLATGASFLWGCVRLLGVRRVEKPDFSAGSHR